MQPPPLPPDPSRFGSDRSGVSCILFADQEFRICEQSLRYFQRQDFPDKELLVITADCGFAERCSSLDGIRFLDFKADLSWLEHLRQAIETCRGRYVALWNCGDWIGFDRLSSQVRHLRETGAAVAVAREVTCYCPLMAQAWILKEPLPSPSHRKTFICDRSFPGFEAQLENFGVPGQRGQTADLLPVTTMPAPWYVGVTWRSVAVGRTAQSAHRKPIAAGEVIRTIWDDREFYLQVRADMRARTGRKTRLRNEEKKADGSRIATRPKSSHAMAAMVSCIMPTRDRRRFLPQAIQCFLGQDHRHRELIIVDDGPVRVEDLIPPDPRIHYVRLNGQRSIGSKRNVGCELAAGEILMCWDDDDWYGPNRISHQVAPLLSGQCDATVLLTGYMLNLGEHSFWSQDLGRLGGLFRQGVQCGSIAWSREWWKKGVRFPDLSLAEDVALQESLIRAGARVNRLPNAENYVYVRHGANTWQFSLDKAAEEGWRMIEPPAFLPDDVLRFYGVPAAQNFRIHSGDRSLPPTH